MVSLEAELDNEVARQVLQLGFPALFPPQAEEVGFVVLYRSSDSVRGRGGAMKYLARPGM